MTDLPHQWLGFVDPDDELAEAVAAQFSQHPDAAIITSFPGLGDPIGARLLAEIGDDPWRGAKLREWSGCSLVHVVQATEDRS